MSNLNGKTVLSKNTLTTTTLIKVVEKTLKLENVKYFQMEKDFGTEKVINGHQSGNGYRAFAEDFPTGTIIEISTKVTLPKK